MAGQFFTNGEKLPNKLESEEFLKYYQEFQKGNIEAKRKLAEHNMRLAIDIANSFPVARYCQDELIAIAMLGLMKSVDTFKLEEGVQFSTYATTVISREIIGFLRKNRKYVETKSLDYIIATDDNDHNLTKLDIYKEQTPAFEDQIVNKMYNTKIRDAMKKILNEQEYTVICYRFGFDGNEPIKQKEVGDILGVSQRRISAIENKALEKLYNKLDKNISEVEDYQKPHR